MDVQPGCLFGTCSDDLASRTDGIHPTDSTYHLWIAVIVAGIESALKCDGALSREPHQRNLKGRLTMGEHANGLRPSDALDRA